MAVNDLRGILAGRIEEEMTGIVLVIGSVDVAVVHGQFEVCGDLAVPLLLLGGLLCSLDRFLDLGEGRFVILRNEQGDGILLIAAVDALGLPDVCKRDAAGHDDLRCGCCIVVCHCFFLLKCSFYSSSGSTENS